MAMAKTGRRNTAGKSGNPSRPTSVGRKADQPARKRPALSMSVQTSGASKRSTLIDRAQASLPGGKSKSQPKGMWSAVTAALTHLGADNKRGGGDRKPSKKGVAGIAAVGGVGPAAMAQRRRAGKTPDAARSPAETMPKGNDGTETPTAAWLPPAAVIPDWWWVVTDGYEIDGIYQPDTDAAKRFAATAAERDVPVRILDPGETTEISAAETHHSTGG